MRALQWLRTLASLWLVALAAASCGGAGFDPPEKIKGLRVLAVQKDNPYPHPGDEVNLKLLYWDAKAQDGSPRDIDVRFFPCVNPRGDLYFNCGYENLLLGASLSSGAPTDAGRDVASSDDSM